MLALVAVVLFLLSVFVSAIYLVYLWLMCIVSGACCVLDNSRRS